MDNLSERVLRVKVSEALESGEVTWPVMSATLSDIVIYAQTIPPTKREIIDLREYIMFVFDSLDAKYHLLEKLDALIDFKKIFGSFFGGMIEKVDSAALRAVVKYIIVPLLLSIFHITTKDSIDD
jgi:hypothetical protein